MTLPPSRYALTRAVAILAACGALIAVVAVGLEVVAYETTRDRWRAISEQLEQGESYDAGASDTLYDQVRARRADAQRDAWIAAALMLVAASCAGRRTARSELDATPGRVLAASALDVTITALVLVGSLGLAQASTSIAATDALTILAPAVVVASLVAMVARGGMPAQRALGLAIAPSPDPIRAPVVVLLLVPSSIWLVVAGVPLALAILAGRTPRASLLAPHVGLAGLRVTRSVAPPSRTSTTSQPDPSR